LKRTVGKGGDVGELLSRINAAGSEGNGDLDAGILGSFLHSGISAKDDQVGQRYLFLLVGRVELVLDFIELRGETTS
jgi:hypothetical protein